MDVTKPKGEVVGSITLHINSKLRISHVEITDRGDLVSKRTVQDSMALIFHAMMQARSKRKASGRASEAEKVRQAETRDTGRLEAFKAKLAKEKAEEEDAIHKRVQIRKDAALLAEEKASVRIQPGFQPKAAKADPVDAKKAAQEAATKEAEKIAGEHAKQTEIKPVTAVKPKEK